MRGFIYLLYSLLLLKHYGLSWQLYEMYDRNVSSYNNGDQAEERYIDLQRLYPLRGQVAPNHVSAIFHRA